MDQSRQSDFIEDELNKKFSEKSDSFQLNVDSEENRPRHDYTVKFTIYPFKK